MEKIIDILKRIENEEAKEKVKQQLKNEYKKHLKYVEGELVYFKKNLNEFIDDNNHCDYLSIMTMFGIQKANEFCDVIADIYKKVFDENIGYHVNPKEL